MLFRLLSWNIQSGGGTRCPAIVRAIVGHDPHTVVLSEFRNNARGVYLRKKLDRHGFVHQLPTQAIPSMNSVLIASRLPFEPRLPSDREESFPHAVAVADYPAFDVYGMYLPHKKKHTWFDVLLEVAAEKKPAILAGDFNSGKNYIDQKGDSFWYSKYLDRLEKLDYVDAFRLARGDVREYSWFSHAGNGFRYDHTYVHPSIAKLVTDCRYSHVERQDGLSDHSAMILELGSG